MRQLIHFAALPACLVIFIHKRYFLLAAELPSGVKVTQSLFVFVLSVFLSLVVIITQVKIKTHWMCVTHFWGHI